ncbi:hypothetical protein DIDNDMLP_00366 [Klebsiella phage KP13-7]|uniref:Uncharacterized protein n=1 Tax=Klebsiella phage vB_KleM_RaK2 TaxID=1147094 RepID=H6X4R1_9CAUD|nr:hypothetical protein F403_gp081 [Klebsiella phage vB_KleM_RaK2]YP_010843471.1 transcription factor IIS-like protein [Klebsiella phage K64-1]AFA44727.1 hypothetical protein RaK2_00454 [Klebsiella phage vB_KleM_RaK2]UYL05351.1 hypothetical protein DIDNDMLP_00366 [Klebsiella phage KP13-7]
MKKCSCCGSTQIARFRLDSDWAVGCGDFYPVNDDSEYTEEQLKDFDNSWRPDFEFLYCLNCNSVQE